MDAPLNDATTAFLRAVRGTFVAFNGFVVEDIRSRSWASVTFSGARHELTFRLEGAGAETEAARFVAELPTAEFDLRGHILADISLVARDCRRDWARITLEALTVEEC